MSFRPLASCGRQQGPGAWGAGMEAKLDDWCAARDLMLHRSKTASGDPAKLLVIIGVPRLMTGVLSLPPGPTCESIKRCLSNHTRPILSQRNWTR